MNRITQYLPSDDLLAVDDLDGAQLLAFDGRGLDPADLRNHQIRWFDSTPGQWLSEEVIGCEADGQNLRPYVGR